MVVGIARLSLGIAGAASLKEKRHALRKVIDRVQAKFNVSIAEVGDNDVWQRSVMGVAAVGNDRAFIEGTLEKVTRFIEETHVVELLDREVEIQSYNEMYR